MQIEFLQQPDSKEDFKTFFCTSQVNTAGAKLDDKMAPLPKSICGSIFNLTPAEKSGYEAAAFKQIAAGKMAILLLAGGQGTRLGVNYPKGMYDVGLPSAKSLFQVRRRVINTRSTF